MNHSRLEHERLKKLKKKYKRKNGLYFFLGILLGSICLFNLVYWYPVLEKNYSFPNISWLPQLNPTLETETTTESSVPMESSSSNEEPEKTFTPRLTYNEINQQGIYGKTSKQLDEQIKQQNVSGTILAVKDNQVLLYDSYGKATELGKKPDEMTYMIASVQKMVTALLIMKLVDQKALDLTSPLSTFFPEIPNSEAITIDSMLSMTSGLFLNSADKPDSVGSTQEWEDFVRSKTYYEPLEKWKYSPVNYSLLAMIVEKLSGMSYNDFFKEQIKEPLHLTHSGLYTDVTPESNLVPSYKVNEDGSIGEQIQISDSTYITELGTGNMYMSASDLLTLLQALLDEKVIPLDSLTNLWKRQEATVPYKYKAGLYYNHDTQSFLGHGIFKGYEPTFLFNNDGSNAVIFLSNMYRKDKTNTTLTDTLFETINQPTPFID